jgi:hypothetical protein
MMDIDSAKIAVMQSGKRILIFPGEGADEDCFAGIILDPTTEDMRHHGHVSCMWDRTKVASLQGKASDDDLPYLEGK